MIFMFLGVWDMMGSYRFVVDATWHLSMALSVLLDLAWCLGFCCLSHKEDRIIAS